LICNIRGVLIAYFVGILVTPFYFTPIFREIAREKGPTMHLRDKDKIEARTLGQITAFLWPIIIPIGVVYEVFFQGDDL